MRTPPAAKRRSAEHPQSHGVEWNWKTNSIISKDNNSAYALLRHVEEASGGL